MTDGGAEVFLRTYNGKSLILPAGWHLTPPKPGEPVAAYRDRAIYGRQVVRRFVTSRLVTPCSAAPIMCRDRQMMGYSNIWQRSMAERRRRQLIY